MIMIGRMFSGIVGAVLCSMPLQMVAQHTMGEAIERYAGVRTGADMFVSTEVVGGNSQSGTGAPRCRIYEFGIPKKMFDEALDPIIKAYEADRSKAYATVEKYVDYKIGDKVTVTYGKRPKDKITFGSRPDSKYLVMAVRDSLNPGKRYVYGLEWYDDPAKRKHIRGTMAVVWGDDPKQLETGLGALPVPTAEQLAGLERLATINPDSLQNLGAEARRDLKSVAELSRMMLKKAENSVGGDDAIVTEDEFLNRFEQLRHSYINAVKSGATTMVTAKLARKIRDLCRNHSDVLSPSIRKNVVAVGMFGVIQAAVDPYETRLLMEVLKGLVRDNN